MWPETLDEFAFPIPETPRDEHNTVDENPDPETPEGQDHQNGGQVFAGIKAVRSEPAEEGTEKKRRNKSTVAFGLKLLIATDQATLRIGKAVGDDDDVIDQGPDAEASQSQQHQNPRADLADIKAVDTKATQKHRQKRGRYKSTITVTGIIHLPVLPTFVQGNRRPCPDRP